MHWRRQHRRSDAIAGLTVLGYSMPEINAALRTLPFYLETPNELPGYAAEIKLLRERFAE